MKRAIQSQKQRGPAGPRRSEEGADPEFRFFLQQELLERCRKNPRYSLRAFARSLGLAPSALSDMLKGKRSVTRKTIQRAGLAMGLGMDQIQRFRGSLGSPMGGRVLAFQQITLDGFAIISDWYHYGILELMATAGFRSDTAWIARRLGITRSEANLAVERLSRVGLLEIRADGSWRDVSGGFTTNIAHIDGTLSSAAARRLQRQVLELSLRALEEVAPERRSHTSMTMAMDPRDLPEARARIQAFRRELCAFLNRPQAKATEVYQLGVSLFPLTQTLSDAIPDQGAQS